jgi:glycosyltransferase involved in cell wall biosynthesis
MAKVPLFITRYSLSPKNAIGVQTNQLLQPQSDWLQFYWSSKDLLSRDSRSIRIENALFSRVSFFQNDNEHVRRLQRLGAGWWECDRLRPERARWLLEKYQHRVSSIYAAPLEKRDARRIRQIIEIFNVPFVLHLWDFLDSRICGSEDLVWLLERAAKVFCLSQPMLDEVSGIRADAEVLLFSRKPSRTIAVAPANRTLRIVMIGNIYSYRHGLDLLDQAIQRLTARGLGVSVCYLGPAKALRSLESALVRKVQPLGFVKGDEGRDRELSKCHVGFMPGPFTDPDIHMRSRYSIPSRILDFLATGLPIVGTVQPTSATGIFCETLGVHDDCFCGTPESIEDALAGLQNQSRWSIAAGKSRRAFDLLSRQSEPEKLKNALARALGNTVT